MNVVKTIIDLINSSPVSSEQKAYWVSNIHSLNKDDLRKLYRALTVRDIEDIEKIENEEIRHQKTIKQGLDNISQIINRYFRDEEKDVRQDESQIAFLNDLKIN